jgi:hypothetical protein
MHRRVQQQVRASRGFSVDARNVLPCTQIAQKAFTMRRNLARTADAAGGRSTAVAAAPQQATSSNVAQQETPSGFDIQVSA